MTAGEPVAVLTDHLRRVEGPWRVGFDLGAQERLVVDRPAGTVTTRRAGDCTDCDIAVPRHELFALLAGDLDPRAAFMYQKATVTGPMQPAVELLDALAGNGVTHHPTLARLPHATTDGAVARRELDEAGYCIVTDALSPDLIDRLRRRVDQQAAGERAAGLAFFEGARADGMDGRPNQRLHALVNKGDVFMELLDHPLVDEFFPPRLGEHFVMASYFCIIAGPGGTPMALHTDQIPVMPVIRDFPVGLNLVFFLDEFTDANGATRVFPGSHLDGNRVAPADIFSMDGTVAAEGPAGAALLFDSRLWHGTGPNRTTGVRRGVFLYFVRSWMRTTENWALTVHPSVLQRLSDRHRTMFGFRQTGGLGRVQGSAEGSIPVYDPDSLILEL